MAWFGAMRRESCGGVLVLMVLAALLCPARSVRAGAWSPERGHGYGKLWLKYLYGFGYVDQRGGHHKYGRYHELFANGYGEIGLGQQVALTLHFPFYRWFSLEDPRSNQREGHSAVGDPTLGVRYQFLSHRRWAGALEGSVRFPLAPSGPQQEFYARDGTRLGDLRIGEGVFDVSPALSVGYGWDRAYAQASVAYVWRSGDYDGALRWTAEVGGTLSARWNTRARATAHHPLRYGRAPRAETPSGIGNGVGYAGLALELEYELVDEVWLGVTAEGGLGLLRSQTGGPVISLYGATRF